MKLGINPLFPTSDNNGISGAYEQAAFMDDTEASLSKKHWGENIGAAQSTHGSPTSYKRFSKKHRENMRSYRESLKQLKQQKRTGEITHAEYLKDKKRLVKQADQALLDNLKKLLDIG